MALTSGQRRYGYARAIRKERVSSLRLRHLSLDEIHRALGEGKQMLVNPKTGKPWQRATIYRDIRELQEIAMANAARDAGKHRAELLAENVQARRFSWAKSDVRAVFTGIDQAAKLTRVYTKGARLNIDMNSLSNEQVERIANGEDPLVVLATSSRDPGEASAGGDVEPDSKP